MKLVKNARSFWRWHSTWAFAALGSLPVVWAQLPADVKAYLPDGWEPWVLAAMAVGGVVSRLRDQGGDDVA